MPMVFSQGDQSHYQQISDDIKKYHLGGIIFSKGTIVEQARLTNFFQSQSKVPLLIAMDAEWGMAMRLHDAKPFPYQMTLGAIQNDSLLYQMGYAMANRQRRLGVHLNFSPCRSYHDAFAWLCCCVVHHLSFCFDRKAKTVRYSKSKTQRVDEGQFSCNKLTRQSRGL